MYFLFQCWEAMSYRYIAEIKDGARRMMRMHPDMARKTDFRRKALSHNATGSSIWAYSTVWLTGRSTGFWQSAVLPKLEERVSRSTRGSILSASMNKKKIRASGEEDRELLYKPNAAAYPAGTPIRVGGNQGVAQFQTRVNGNQGIPALGFPTHGGCKSADGIRRRGKQEAIQVKGPHPLIGMHIAFRGGHRPEKKIPVKDIDVHVRKFTPGNR